MINKPNVIQFVMLLVMASAVLFQSALGTNNKKNGVSIEKMDSAQRQVSSSVSSEKCH